MSRTQLHDLARRLEAQYDELATASDSSEYLEAGRASDPIDEVQRREELNLAASTLSASYERRRRIQAALVRIREGRFGICEDCGENISLKRIEAAPWAELCIECQEAAEQDSLAA